jgi:hypothetical protein
MTGVRLLATANVEIGPGAYRDGPFGRRPGVSRWRNQPYGS